ncbi:MAG TPA: ATP-binding protein [Terracidiphilus sp.]|nr:ATP-binding protein [Terracidiphilus sp.]
MRSLFLKIFIIFWIAESLIFVISTALILNRRFPGPAPFLAPAYNALRGESAHAIADYEAHGCTGLLQSARERKATEALADANGNMLCQSDEFKGPQAVPPAAEIGGVQAGNNYIWTVREQSASGKSFLYMLSVPRMRGRRTWYGDMWRFAFPQLPVAIAVGGAATFVLVLVFTRPVARLRKAARELARGQLGTRVKESRPGATGKGDEFAGLVHDFNHMAERLESLVSAQRMLLRDVSHELRSPLARLSVALELSRDDADATMSSHLDRIERETERLNQLIGQLLTLAQMETAETLDRAEHVSLKKLIEQMIPDAEYEARQRDAVVELHAECECVVDGRRELLYRAIENVVRNAIRYTEAGTRVEVRLAEDRPRKMAVIEVSDRGPGIPEAELEAIFRPFYRLDTARSAHTGGVGVGLAIAERAVKLHSGQIRALNRDGGGTTIRISLPVAA